MKRRNRKKICHRKRKQSHEKQLNLLSLPPEMIFCIFNNLNLADLASLSQSSKQLHNVVFGYIQSPYFDLTKIYEEWIRCEHDFLIRDDSNSLSEFGMFFRKILIFMSCKAKIKFVLDILTASNCPWKQKDDNFILHSKIMFFMITDMLKEESKDNLHAAFRLVNELNGMQSMMLEVLRAEEGLKSSEENLVRFYYRCFYYDYLSPEEKTVSISFLLKELPLYFQAKFLLLLLLPVEFGIPMKWSWYFFCQLIVLCGTKVLAEGIKFFFSLSRLHELCAFIHDIVQNFIEFIERITFEGFSNLIIAALSKHKHGSPIAQEKFLQYFRDFIRTYVRTENRSRLLILYTEMKRSLDRKYTLNNV